MDGPLIFLARPFIFVQCFYPLGAEILIAVFDEEEDTLNEENGIKKAPFNHPRLAGDASLGLSPINPNTQR